MAANDRAAAQANDRRGLTVLLVAREDRRCIAKLLRKSSRMEPSRDAGTAGAELRGSQSNLDSSFRSSTKRLHSGQPAACSANSTASTVAFVRPLKSPSQYA